MDETGTILGALAIVALVCGVGGFVLYKSLHARAQVWNAVLKPLGGLARAHLGLNSVLRAELRLENGALVVLEQWQSRADHVSTGQIVMTVKKADWGFSDFFVGADGWAHAFARWAPRLPQTSGLAAACSAVGMPAPEPLTQGRGNAELPAPACLTSTSVLGQLAALRVYVLFGRAGWVRLHIPGGVTHPDDTPLLLRVVELARSMAT